MKKIFCEACGSKDLTKIEECYVCDYCGTKYREEEVAEEASDEQKDDRISVSISINPDSPYGSFQRKAQKKEKLKFQVQVSHLLKSMRYLIFSI